MSSHSDAPAGSQRSMPAVEQLEDRLTPSTSSILLPAFYQDLLNRAPDAGSATFAAQLDAGVRPAQVAYQIETAAGNEYRFDLVQSYYARFLHRKGTVEEVNNYVNNYLAAGATDEQVEAIFLGSQEYFRLHNSDNGAWLNAVYMDLLARPNWENAHLDELASTSRQAVATGILKGIEAATQQLELDYRQYLGRTGFQDVGRDGYAKQLLAGTMTDEQIIAELLGSPEYLANNTPVPGPGGPQGLVGPGAAFATARAYATVAANGALSDNLNIVSVTVHANGSAGSYSIVLDPSIDARHVTVYVAADINDPLSITNQAHAELRADNAFTAAGVNGISVQTFNMNVLAGTYLPADEGFIVIVL